LVGQFGSGEIAAFDAVTGSFKEPFRTRMVRQLRIQVFGVLLLALGTPIPERPISCSSTWVLIRGKAVCLAFFRQ
jgi:hypothetical protein